MAEEEKFTTGTGSKKDENDGVSPQKRKPEVSEKDTNEPVEKKPYSTSTGKPVVSMSFGKPSPKIGITMNLGSKKTVQMAGGESKQGVDTDKKGPSIKPAPIKMSLASQPKESSVAVKPQNEKIASVFNEDSEDEEEMPPEAKMKMRNVGRQTPTAAGPNSYGKNNLGFCDRNKMIERELKQKLLEMGDSDDK